MIRARLHIAKLLAIALAMALTLSAQALAEEVIHSFTSNVTLLQNGNVDVTETISVRAEGVSIRRGIFRDIPTRMINEDGSVLRSNLNVLEVTRDGRSEPWHTESIRDGVRIYVGDADVFLRTGTYTYTIRYTMTRMARRFENYDELYWNATGNFWAFPIQEANAIVSLPDGAVIGELRAYTGAFGATGTDATARRTSDNTAIFRATRPLRAYEGMTISVSFNKGILSEPSWFESVLFYLSDHRDTVFPLFAVFIALLYNFFAWDAVGRDPPRGTIIPLFYPPRDFSPALVHYVHNLGWKNSGWTAYSAALISLAIKKLIQIDKDGKDNIFTSLGRPEAASLPIGEAVVEGFVRSKGTLKVDKTTGSSIHSNKSKFISAIEKENRRAYFNNNVFYVFIGVVLAIVMLVALVIFEALDPIWLVLSVGAGVGIGLFTSLVSSFWRGGNFVRFVFLLWGIMAFSNIFSGVANLLTGFEINVGAISALSIAALTIFFGILMRAPTVQGRKVMDEIDGFKMYLETAEKERLNFAGEPDFTIKRFEQILPYAMALGVERPWSERLEGELARDALPEAATGYHPTWYHGTDFSGRNLSQNMATMASGMSAAMISAQPVSSSSSGGGGGGFSGGGGGGGGGGGW